MIRHLPFYCIEATLITLLVWLGLFLAVNGGQRMGVAIRPRWTVTIAALWIAIACTGAVLSEMIGPEFTLHYYFGIWTLIGGSALWLVAWAHRGGASLRDRFSIETGLRKEP
jgi:hypothetical protein